MSVGAFVPFECVGYRMDGTVVPARNLPEPAAPPPPPPLDEALLRKATNLYVCSNRVQAVAMIIAGTAFLTLCICAIAFGGPTHIIVAGTFGLILAPFMIGSGIFHLKKVEVPMSDMRFNKVILVVGVALLALSAILIWRCTSGLAVPDMVKVVCLTGMVFSLGSGMCIIPALMRMKAQSISKRLYPAPAV